MRGLWLTFGPMLAAAALVLWGGERLHVRPAPSPEALAHRPQDIDQALIATESAFAALARR